MDKLTDLLEQSTVSIHAHNSKGSGFFIRPNIVLTCNHVIEDAHNKKIAIEVLWQGNQANEVSILEYSSELDLALLSVSYGINMAPYVSVNMNMKIRDRLFSYGYPEESRTHGDYSKGDSLTVEYEGTSKTPLLLKLKQGQIISGFSGAPLINLRTGGVCGVVRISRGDMSDLGGRAIPISSALEYFKNLSNNQEVFNNKNKQWNLIIADYLSASKAHNGHNKFKQVINNNAKIGTQVNIGSVETLRIGK